MSGFVLGLNILFTILSDGSYALLVGCLLADSWIPAAAADVGKPSPKANSAAFLQPLSTGCAAALLLSHLVRPWFTAASMTASSGFAENLAAIPDILSSTHQGALWLVNSLPVAVLLAVILLREQMTKRLASVFSVASVLLIACTKAASGHASNGGDFTLAEFSMLLHLLGIAVWAGAMIASGLFVLPHLARLPDGAALWTYAGHLSRTVTWAVMVIAVSGVYTSYRDLNGSWSGLWSSGWGRILLAKLSLVLLALALGAFTRFTCLRNPVRNGSARLVQLVRAEAVVMILVVGLSGALANTPPAMTETTALLSGLAAQ